MAGLVVFLMTLISMYMGYVKGMENKRKWKAFELEIERQNARAAAEAAYWAPRLAILRKQSGMEG